MKKSHLILLIVTLMTALFSAYSLAAINQTYKLDFDWYSQYFEKFTVSQRMTDRDKWMLQDYPKTMGFHIISEDKEWERLEDGILPWGLQLPAVDLSRYIVLYCTFGKVNSPEYRLKITDIAQRGNVVEAVVSVNSPEKPVENVTGVQEHYISDIVRIDKRAFSEKGKLIFIFKNQSGEQLSEQYYWIN